MNDHAPTTIGTWTCCQRCITEEWPCLHVQLESRRRGRLAIALLSVGLTLAVLLLTTLVLTP